MQIFKSQVWPREWRLDDIGVHEFRNNQHHASISWVDLERMDQRQLCASHGIRLAILLPAKLRVQFLSELNREWQCRFPERFRANETCNLRRQAWRAFLWMPLTCAGLVVLTYYRLFVVTPYINVTAHWVIQANLSIFRGDQSIIIPPILAGRLFRFDCTVVLLGLALCSGWVGSIRRYWKHRQI